MEIIQYDNDAEKLSYLVNSAPSILKELASQQNAMSDFFEAYNSITNGIVHIEVFSKQVNEFLAEVKEDEKLYQAEFKDKYIAEMEICENIGKNGWVITEYGCPADIINWITLLNSGKSESIVNYFQDEKKVLTNIISGLLNRYTSGPDKLYFDKAYDYFEKEDYMTSAMYLVGLIEQRCNKRIDFRKDKNNKNHKSYKEKYSNEGFKKVLNNHFTNVPDRIVKHYLFLQIYPSLIFFLNRLFVDGKYSFENGVEPPYINRNWLLHGKNTRTIEKYECIQLFNALSVLEFVCDLTK